MVGRGPLGPPRQRLQPQRCGAGVRAPMLSGRDPMLSGRDRSLAARGLSADPSPFQCGSAELHCCQHSISSTRQLAWMADDTATGPPTSLYAN
jgi:hypothetical protein